MTDTGSTSRGMKIFSILQSMILVGLAVAMIWLITNQRRLTNELAVANQIIKDVPTQHALAEQKMAAFRLSQETYVTEQLGKMAQEVNQQTAVMHRALGKVIPVVMPPEWEKQLAGLEQRIKDDAARPNNVEEAKQYIADITTLIKGLPVWAEEDYLPRLTCVRWAAMAFEIYYRDTQEPDLQDRSDSIRELANSMPDESNTISINLDSIKQWLIARADEYSIKHHSHQLSKARDSALYFVQNRTTGDNTINPEDAYDILVQDNDPNAKILGEKLHKIIIDTQINLNVTALEEKWAKFGKLEYSHPTVFEMSTQMMLSEIAAARVALATDGILDSGYNELDNKVRSALKGYAKKARELEEVRQANAVREYQRWALRMINKFNDEYSGAEADSKNGSWNGKWKDANYQRVRNAMVNHLLSINVGLLELPVYNKYQEAFNIGWKCLDGREEQTFVAEKTISVQKISLQYFLDQLP